MKYIKLFEQFLYESGNLIDNAIPIDQKDVFPTVNWIEKNIFPDIGLSGIEVDAAVIGSAGKKATGQTSGDIDIAISADKIASALNTSLQNVLFSLNDKLKSLGYSTKLSPGFNQVSIGVPILGDPKRGYVQVDLMISTNLEWSKFIYHSPDFRIAESKYKGAYRNLLFMAAIGQSFKKILKKTDKDETVEFEAYVVRLNQGIVNVRKSFEGKRGNLLKTATLLREYDKLITSTPQEAIDLLFRDSVPSDIDTYEKLKTLIDSSLFKYPEIRKNIYNDFKIKIEDNGLPLPN